jgi:hypothetical protein
MSEKQAINLNLVELINLSVKILDQIFLKSSKQKAKLAFKTIKQGEKLSLGTIRIKNSLEPTLKLALDYSEFRGPGFNFEVFEHALRGIFLQISKKFQQQADLNVMTSAQGSVLIHLPGFVQRGDQLNVLLLSFDLSSLDNITIQLMFVEPRQYAPTQKAAES